MESVVRRYPEFKPGWGCESRQYVEFTINRPITIIGFGLYGNSDPSNKLPIMLIDLTTKKAYGKNEATFERHSDRIINRVDLSEPVDIQPGNKYRALVHFYDGLTVTTFYGNDGAREVEVDDVEFVFRTAYKKTVKEGQIPEIYFQKRIP